LFPILNGEGFTGTGFNRSLCFDVELGGEIGMTCGSVLMIEPAGPVADVACGTGNRKGGGGGNESLTG